MSENAPSVALDQTHGDSAQPGWSGLRYVGTVDQGGRARSTTSGEVSLAHKTRAKVHPISIVEA